LVFADFGFEQLIAMSAQALEGSYVIELHEAAVADHIGGKNSGKSALSAFFDHSWWKLSQGAAGKVYVAPAGESIAPRSRPGQKRRFRDIRDMSPLRIT
jgi:hypothetical protein